MARSVLVAGGDRGAGKAIAARFADLHHWVAVTYRSVEPPGDLLAVPCDITDTSQVEAAYREVEDAHGPVEVLVAHAAIAGDGPLLPLRVPDAAVPESVIGSMPLVERAVEEMRWGDWGRIILIAPTQAPRATAGLQALAGLVRSLGRDLARHGVTVNVVAPGMTTEDLASHHSGGATGLSKTQICAGLIRPADVAAAVAFLASPEASHITGTVFPVKRRLETGT
ncbi:SDR family oxidoreductase [Streptomyces sp. NPDC002402]